MKCPSIPLYLKPSYEPLYILGTNTAQLYDSLSMHNIPSDGFSIKQCREALLFHLSSSACTINMWNLSLGTCHASFRSSTTSLLPAIAYIDCQLSRAKWAPNTGIYGHKSRKAAPNDLGMQLWRYTASKVHEGGFASFWLFRTIGCPKGSLRMC
ncbi:hypothetical protein PM082_008920 [Marasmius tenuissimus]|nr:hypothetical protein PM082_008920 [Marasmius tenuissimus]